MEEELENGISLMEGILQNWANENKGKYHIFFPRCAKENDKDVVLFPIFEENKNGTLNLKVWAKYSLEKKSGQVSLITRRFNLYHIKTEDIFT